MADNILNGYVNLERFWANVQKTESCWLWTSRATTGGRIKYGLVSIRVLSPRGTATRLESAHRISFELTNGPIPAGLHVLHSCDIGLCVNPTHLRLGTTQDNIADKISRNRHPRGGRVPGVVLPRASLPTRIGERHWHAKLSNAQVVEMRSGYASDPTLSVTALARRYAVSAVAVARIITGESRRTAGGPTGPIRKIYGSSVPGAKLTTERVGEMRGLYATGDWTIYDLADRFGIAPQTVSNVIRNKTWKHAPLLPTSAIRRGHRKLTPKQVTTIRQRHGAGVSGRRLAADYRVSPATISFLVHRATHR